MSFLLLVLQCNFLNILSFQINVTPLQINFPNDRAQELVMALILSEYNIWELSDRYCAAAVGNRPWRMGSWWVRSEKDEESRWLWSKCTINNNNCRYVFAQCSPSLRLPHWYKKMARIGHSYDYSYARALEGSGDFSMRRLNDPALPPVGEREFRVERGRNYWNVNTRREKALLRVISRGYLKLMVRKMTAQIF